MPAPLLYTYTDLERVTGLNVRTLQRLVRARGAFPQPVDLGTGRRTMFRASDVEQWVAGLETLTPEAIAARRPPQKRVGVA